MFAVFHDVLGSNDTHEISEDKFKAIDAARKSLNESNELEERFWVVCELYRELEETSLQSALNYAVYPNFNSTDFMLARSLIGMRVFSLLSASCLYLDKCGGSAKKITVGKINAEEAKKITHEVHAKHFEYRFSCELRNYAIHKSIPVHGIALDLSRKIDLDLWDHKIEYSIPIAPLLAWKKLNGNLRKELEKITSPSIDLKTSIRKFFSLICDIHKKIREVIAEAEISAETTLKNAHPHYSAGELPPGLCACELDDQGLKIPGGKLIPLNIPDDNVRNFIRVKTRSMVNIEKRRVS